MNTLTTPAAAVAPERSEAPSLWSKMRRSRFAVPGGLIVLAYVLLAIFAPWIATHDPLQTNLSAPLLAPHAGNIFGTDELGRDVFSRVAWGARLSLMEGMLAVGLALAIGVPLGMVSGYAGGKVDVVLMRLLDVLMAFPGVLLAVVIVSMLGASLVNAMIAVAIYTVPIFARLARALTLSVKQEPYIEACRAAGLTHTRTLFWHILPNISRPILVMSALRVAIAILTAAGLSFLGLGAQPPSPEWGAMLANGRNYVLVAPHMVIFPGAAIVLLVFGLNLLQEGMSLALDPKERPR